MMVGFVMTHALAYDAAGVIAVMLGVTIRGIKEDKVRTVVLGLHFYMPFSLFCLKASDFSREKDKKAM